MKRFLLIAFLSLYGLGALGAVPTVDVQLLYDNRSGTAGAMRTLSENLSSTEAAIIFLRRIRTEGTYVENGMTFHRGDATRLLAILGDAEIIKEKYDAFLNAKNDTSKGRLLNSDLGQVLHPRVIGVLGPDLAMPTVKIRLTGEVDGFDVPYANAAVILNVIIRSGYFNQDIQNWAKGLDSKHGWNKPEHYLGDIRAFWAENAAFLEAGEYDLARPPNPESNPQNEPNVPAAPSPPPPPEPTPMPIKSAVETSNAYSPAKRPQTESSNRTWWVFGGLALVLGAGFVFRRKNTPPEGP